MQTHALFGIEVKNKRLQKQQQHQQQVRHYNFNPKERHYSLGKRSNPFVPRKQAQQTLKR